MNEFTEVGPPDKHDRPRKRGRLLDAILRVPGLTSITNPLVMRGNWVLFWKTRELKEGAEPRPMEEAWHGLPEAELTEEQERQAISEEAWQREHRGK